MSDFIYSKKSIKPNILTQAIQKIYFNNPPKVQEYHGEWGSLAISENIYKGFQPLETKEHIVVVIGGPLLTFDENRFIGEKPLSNTGTELLYHRWLNNDVKWEEDLTGPFVVLILNKQTGDIFCVTDLMSYIPVFEFQSEDNIMLGTHVDALAEVSRQKGNIDLVSCVDFILSGIVTFPYTLYQNIRQINPGSQHRIMSNTTKLISEYYWLPKEEYKYNSIKEASKKLQSAIENYVETILINTNNIAQFISGGEDSRVLTALLAKAPGHNAFIFLDQMNREGKVAKKAAEAYGANFQLFLRNKLHYLDILPACSKLVGSGSEYIHGHTFGFHEKCNLNGYDAVFGGLFSDALLKGSRIRKIRGSKRFPFIPHIKSKYSPDQRIKNNAFKDEVLNEVVKRRREHLNFIKKIRPESAEEWFELWPSSMNLNFPNNHANRRLFRSYEPFMDSSVVKISASVPQNWKMNRKLFLSFAKPYLKQTKWLFHSEGRLPYFPWYINSFVQFFFWLYQKVGEKIGLIKGNQGPWADWSSLMDSPEWKEKVLEYGENIEPIADIITEDNITDLYNNKDLNYLQKINLIQLLFTIKVR